MAHQILGSCWDTLRAHLGALGLHLGAPGNHFGALGGRFGRQGLPFRGPGAPHGHIFFDLAAILLKMRKSCQNLVFLWFFNDVGGQEGIKIDENSEKIEPSMFGNAQKLSGMGRIDRIGCPSGQCGFNGISVVGK